MSVHTTLAVLLSIHQTSCLASRHHRTLWTTRRERSMNSKWYQTSHANQPDCGKKPCTRSHSQRRAHSLSPLISLCSEQLLRQVAMGKDTKTKRDIIQKVIAYMTLGIDVSRLFSEMVLVRSHSTTHACSAARLAAATRSHPAPLPIRFPTPSHWLSRRWCFCTSATTQPPTQS